MIKPITHSIVTSIPEYEFTPEWIAIKTRAEAELFDLPSYTAQVACDVLIRRMIDNGIWNKLDLFFNFAYGEHDGLNLWDISLINWKNPTGPLAINHGGLNYWPSGISGNNSDAFVNTTFNPTVGTNNYTLNDACRGGVVYIYDNTDNSFDGQVAALNRLFLSNGVTHRINSDNLNLQADMSQNGFKMISRSDNTNVMLINKNIQMDRIAASTSVASEQQLILRSGAAGYGTSTISCYFLGGAISYAQSQVFRTSYNNFLQRVGLTPVA